jgi:hypothetical protein
MMLLRLPRLKERSSEASGEEGALRRLQLDWLLRLADLAGTAATIGVPGKWDVHLIAPEIDNVRAALECRRQARGDSRRTRRR